MTIAKPLIVLLLTCLLSLSVSASAKKEFSDLSEDWITRLYSALDWDVLGAIRSQIINQRAHVVTSKAVPLSNSTEVNFPGVNYRSRVYVTPAKSLSGIMYTPGMRLKQGRYILYFRDLDRGAYYRSVTLGGRRFVYEPDWNSTAYIPLYVMTVPVDAKVRIMNIEPRFYSGILLKPGRYDIEVSYPGYKSKRMWVSLSKEQTTFHMALNRN